MDALPFSGAVASWRLGHIGLRAGIVHEPQSALQLRTRGAFGDLSSSLAYAGFGGAIRVDGCGERRGRGR